MTCFDLNYIENIFNIVDESERTKNEFESICSRSVSI